MHRFGWLAVMAALGATGCTDSNARASAAGGGAAVRSAPPRVDGAEARRLVRAGALLLDVRTDEEYADGHIDGARNLPLGRLGDEMGSLPRDRPIVVYCAVGGRAARAAEVLHAAGYDVRDLGAMSAWGR